jgi:hypothetical protein
MPSGEAECDIFSIGFAVWQPRKRLCAPSRGLAGCSPAVNLDCVFFRVKLWRPLMPLMVAVSLFAGLLVFF